MGFPCTDSIPPDVFVPIDKAIAPLHNELRPKAPPNRYRMTVFVQGERVACNLEAIDLGIDLGRLYTYEIPDFDPFEGYLGVTASTGGARQNHILHSAKLTILPDDFCLDPPARATRTLTTVTDPDAACGDFQPGDEIPVDISILEVREASANCGAPASVIIRETLPEGWSVKDGTISTGGTYDEATRTISWTVANPTDAVAVTYTAVAGDSGAVFAAFSGKVLEGEAEEFNDSANRIEGDSSLKADVGFDACGGITCWNLLGALERDGGAAPGEDVMRMDYLTDGDVDELSFVFKPGATVEPDFFGESAATGLFPDAFDRNPDGAAGIATVLGWNDADNIIDFNDEVYGGDQVMAYAQTYIEAEEQIVAILAVSSDDSVQVILNEEEVWINNADRGGSSACDPQDIVFDPVVLVEGENRLIVKVFEGASDWNFSLRFQDENGDPITEGLRITKQPILVGCRKPAALATRTIGTDQTILIGARETQAWGGAAIFDVTIEVADIRGAGGDCAVPASVTITETVPDGGTAKHANAGGTIADGKITWVIDPASPAMLTYQVDTGVDPGNVTFTGSVTEPDSEFRSAVRGIRALTYVPPPFGRGEGVVFIADNFDEPDEEACPDGWSCNCNVGGCIGFGRFTPGVTQEAEHEGRLRLAADGVDGIAATVIWEEPLDLTDNSFTAEFDVYFTGSGDPADGLAIIFLDADVSTATSVGGAGTGIGYSGLSGFAIEFDLWNSGGEPSGYNDNDWGHVALIRDGNVLPHSQTHIDLNPNMFPESLGGDGWPEFVDFIFGSGFPRHLEVDYNNGRIQAWLSAPETESPLGPEPEFDRTLVIDTVVTFPQADGVEPVLQNVLIGFSGGTGGANAHHEVDDVLVTVYPKVDIVGASLKPGDVNYDGDVNISDPVAALNFLFGGQALAECYATVDGAVVTLTEAGLAVLDWNGDGSHNIADPVASLGSQFGGGAGHALGGDCVTVAGSCVTVCQ